MSGRTVVLTGGTAGIGQALAQHLRQSGDRVVVVGRRLADHPDSIVVDLKDSDALDRVMEGLQRLGVDHWDLLIHNAGVGWIGAFPEQPATSIVELLQVNVWQPIALTHRLLPTASPKARIVFISSPVAQWPSPDYAVYAASKAALEAFARALRAERTGVAIQVIRPGATATEMLSSDDAARLGISTARFAHSNATAEQIARILDGPPRWSGTERFSNLSSPLSRWGMKRWIRRRPRIAWPVGLFSPSIEPARSALITGAAEGIGRALALRFAAKGFRIVGVDQNTDGLAETMRLVETIGGAGHSIVADLADRTSLDRLAESLERFEPFAVVVHNAGINRFGRFTEATMADQEKVFAVNLVAPILLTRELLVRRLLASGCRLGFVSSLSHFVGYPGSAVYAATKSGLASFAESLSVVGREYGFSTTTIFPGPTRTRQAFENSPDNSREHRRTDPDVLAEAIVRAMMRRKPTLIHGFGNRAAAELGLRFPRLTDSLMRRALLKPSSERREAE
jgi:short-subunit dehydrogenase